MDLNSLKKTLEAHGQSQLLEGLSDSRFCDDCRAEYLKKLAAIDYDLTARLYRQAAAPAGSETPEGAGEITPIPVTDSAKLTPEQRRQYIAAGEAIIARGEFAAVTMARLEYCAANRAELSAAVRTMIASFFIAGFPLDLGF